jgi:hypothetical protein
MFAKMPTLIPTVEGLSTFAITILIALPALYALESCIVKLAGTGGDARLLP